jgi:hypothetical protein
VDQIDQKSALGIFLDIANAFDSSTFENKCSAAEEHSVQPTLNHLVVDNANDICCFEG